MKSYELARITLFLLPLLGAFPFPTTGVAVSEAPHGPVSPTPRPPPRPQPDHFLVEWEAWKAGGGTYAEPATTEGQAKRRTLVEAQHAAVLVLLKKLDDDSFKVREAARAETAKLLSGPRANLIRAMLRHALPKLPPEPKQAVRELLATR